MLKAIALARWVAIGLLPHNSALAEQVRGVASNNAYPDIARQIGGAARPYPQFHISPIGVWVLHGPETAPFQRPWVPIIRQAGVTAQ